MKIFKAQFSLLLLLTFLSLVLLCLFLLGHVGVEALIVVVAILISHCVTSFFKKSCHAIIVNETDNAITICYWQKLVKYSEDYQLDKCSSNVKRVARGRGITIEHLLIYFESNLVIEVDTLSGWRIETFNEIVKEVNQATTTSQ